MRFDIMLQGAVCGLLSLGVAGMMYLNKEQEPLKKMETLDTPFYNQEPLESVTKEPHRMWYKLNSEGNWVQLKPEFESVVDEGFQTGEDTVDTGKYTIHYNANRGEWKYWLENPEKETFIKLKFEET